MHGRGRGLFVKRGNDGCPVERVHLAEDVGEIGRVEALQLLALQTEAQLLGTRLDGVHVLPTDEVLVRALSEPAPDAQSQTLEVEAAQQASSAHPGRHQPHLALHRAELEVVHPHDAMPLDINDLAVKDGRGEQNVIGIELGGLKLARGGGA